MKKAFVLSLLFLIVNQLSAFQRPGLILEVPFNDDYNLIFLPVTIDGKEFSMIVDTGAAFTVIDDDQAVALNLPVSNRQTFDQPGGQVRLGIIQSLTFGVDTLNIGLQNVRAANLSEGGFNKIIGKETLGIFGHDFISQFTLEVDYAKSTLRFFDKQLYQYTGSGEVITTEIKENKPLVEGFVLNGGKSSKGNWLIDTGSLMSVGLQEKFAKDHGIMEETRMYNSLSAGFGGTTPGKMYTVDGFYLNNIVLPYVVSGHAVGDETLSTFVQDGVIGGEILRRFTLVIDYERSRFIFEKNDQFSQPVYWDLTGLMLFTTDNSFSELEVKHVTEDSPAFMADIQIGDIIHSINGKPVSEVTLPKLWFMHRQEGKTVRFGIRRGNDRIEKEVRMAFYFR